MCGRLAEVLRSVSSLILSLCQPDYVSETSVFTPAASAQTFGLGGVTGRKQVLPKSMEQQQRVLWVTMEASRVQGQRPLHGCVTWVVIQVPMLRNTVLC